MPPARQPYAIFFWLTAVACAAWAPLYVFVSSVRGSVPIPPEFSECFLAAWDTQGPRPQSLVHSRADDIADWMLPGQPVLLAVLAWVVARRGTSRTHLAAAAAGMTVIAVGFLANMIRAGLTTWPDIPECAGVREQADTVGWGGLRGERHAVTPGGELTWPAG